MSENPGGSPAGTPPDRTHAGESTLTLVRQAKSGDREALTALYERYLPRLRRWASGRLPRWARRGMDTSDLVQESLVESLRRIGSFEPRHPGALQAYLYQVLRNRVYKEVQRAMRQSPDSPIDSGYRDPQPSPLEQAIGRESLQRYEAALNRLGAEAREAIVLRLEMGLSYEEVAAALGKPSADAGRKFVIRSLRRLAENVREG